MEVRDESITWNRTGLFPVHIVATDLDDAWFKVQYSLMLHGHRWTIERGSGGCEGQERIEFDIATVQVTQPDTGPLLPIMPEGSGIPPVADLDYVEQDYFSRYIMSDVKAENEEYTYGERINFPVADDLLGETKTQIEWAIKMLAETPMTNQATMEIGRPEDITVHPKPSPGQDLSTVGYDPPCMRVMDWRVRYGKLHLFVYFRSWDAWGGFPVNMAALELLKRHVAEQVGVANGELIGLSKGLHIYGHAEELAKIRTHIESKK